MKHNHSKFYDKNGFTLVEILVAIGIFSLVISVTVGIFVGGSSSQKKIMELSDTQREAGYLMETVSRELRMATAINSDQENIKSSHIEFTNYENTLIEYCMANPIGNCSNGGKYFARDGEVINSSSIEIEDLIFYVTDNFDGLVPADDKKQPVITVVMKVKSTGQYGTDIILQNSIALRLYE